MTKDEVEDVHALVRKNLYTMKRSALRTYVSVIQSRLECEYGIGIEEDELSKILAEHGYFTLFTSVPAFEGLV